MASQSKPALKYIVIGFCFTLTAIISGYYFVHEQQFDKKLTLPQEVAKQDHNIKVNPNTILIQKIIYTKCNEEEVLKTKPPDNLMGLTYAQMQKVYPGWNIDKFDADEIVLTIKIDSLCREHANNMFLGIKDGKVAVFYGKPGAKAILKEITPIIVAKLIEQDREELKHGLAIGSKEDLLKTLEGLQSR